MTSTKTDEPQPISIAKEPSDANEPFRIQFYKDGLPIQNIYIGIPFAPLKLLGLTLRQNQYLLVAGTDF